MERTLKFNIDSKNAAAGLRELDSGLKRTGRQGDMTADMVSKAAKRIGIGIGVAVGATTAFLTVMVSKSLAAGDALGKMSDKIGLSTEALATLNYQAELFTSAGAGAMSEALTKATKRLGEFNATGGGAASRWIKQLNLDTQQLAQLSPDQLFNKYAESIRGLNTRGEQLAAISALMGDESRALIGIVDASSESLAQAAADAEIFGLTLSRVDASKMEIVNDEMTKVRKLMTGFGNTLTIAIAPVLRAVLGLFVDNAREAGGFGEVATKVADGVITAFGVVGDVVRGLQRIFVGVQTAMAAVILGTLNAVKFIGQAFVDLNNITPFAKHMDSFTAVDLAIRTMTDSLTGFTNKLVDLRNAELPSVLMENAYIDSKNSIEAEAKAAVASTGKGKAIETTSVSSFTSGDQSAVDKLMESLMTEEALLFESYDRKQLLVQDALANEYISRADQTELLLALDADYESQRTALAIQGDQDRLNLLASNTANVGSMFGSLSQIMNKEGKKQSTAQKVFAKAAIIASTSAAIMKSHAQVPWPGNWAEAGAIALQGAVQLSKIGSGGSISSGSAGVAPSNVAAPPPVSTPMQLEAPRGETVIQFTGNFTGWNDQVIDDLTAAIASAVDDRDVRIISPTSRNAQDLAAGY